MQNSIKIIAIVGPTASGKSDLAAHIAQKINGEIISVDSRQVYKGMDIGTGKVPITSKLLSRGKMEYMYMGIPHWGLDIANPKSQYSVTKFQKYAKKKIIEITKRGNFPILCGGTAHWMDAVVFEQQFPQVPPNPKLRKQLEGKTTEHLFKQLEEVDPGTAKRVDQKNPRRLIRAIEIITATGETIPAISASSPYECLWIGLRQDTAVLRKNIEKRLTERIEQGLMAEVENLHSSGLSWKKLESFGLEYKFSALLLQGKLNKMEFSTLLTNEIWHYAKRQMTWWKRNDAINWFETPARALSKIKKLTL